MIITSLATLLLTLSAGTALSASSNTSLMGNMEGSSAMVGANTNTSAGANVSDNDNNANVSSSASLNAGLGAMLNL